MTFGATPSIESIDIASPNWSGAVERSPCYALPLNAEPPACHINDHRLSAGCRWAEPAREGFSLEGYLLTQLGSLPPFHTDGFCVSMTTRYSHFCFGAEEPSEHWPSSPVSNLSKYYCICVQLICAHSENDCFSELSSQPHFRALIIGACASVTAVTEAAHPARKHGTS